MCRTSKRDLAASCCCCSFFLFSYKSLIHQWWQHKCKPQLHLRYTVHMKRNREENICKIEPKSDAVTKAISKICVIKLLWNVRHFSSFLSSGGLEKLSQHIGDWMSEWLRLNMSVSVGVWKCVQAYVWFAVCVCVVQCRTKADTHQQSWRVHNTFGAGKRGRLSSSLKLAETPMGTTCLSQARNPFVWLILKV